MNAVITKGRWKEQFINDDGMLTEIIRELATIKYTKEITNEQVCCWARRDEMQRAHKVILDVTKK